MQNLKDSQLFKKIKSIKNIQIIAIIFIIAISLIIYSSVSATKDTKSQQVPSVMNDEETRLCSILANIEGAGAVQAMISKNGNEIVGVLIIAEGGKNPLVKIRLIDAASTALGVDKNIVNVFAKQN